MPVIAYGRSSACDSVEDDVTGVLYDDPGVDGLCGAIERFEALSFDDGDLRRRAAGFSPKRFRREMAGVLVSVGGEVGDE